jgi:hypothetical protein
MKKLLFAFFFISSNVFALEAVVTVLEAPLFKYRSREAPVVQYLRKGDVIKIHPSIANDSSMDKYAPSPEKLAALRKKMKESSDFSEDANTAFLEDEFIPTLDRQGNTVYILSDYIYVYFNDSRELNQTVNAKDPTEYRLKEPLPKKYPLKSPSGYRGQFLLGLTQPYYESYPYNESVKTKGYRSPLDANFTLLKQAPGNYHERLFIGGTIGIRYFENTYSFPSRRFATETGLRFGLGPTISYDAYKGEKNRLNLSGTVIFNILDRLSIRQELDKSADSRVYTGYSVAPRLSFQYHRKGIFEDVDFVLGTSLEVGSATNYQAKNGGEQPDWWQKLGSDKFTTRTTFTLGGYVGVQSAY